MGGKSTDFTEFLMPSRNFHTLNCCRGIIIVVYNERRRNFQFNDVLITDGGDT